MAVPGQVCGCLAEARKRLFYDAKEPDAFPCAPEVKRRLVQNFAFEQTHSRPAHGHFGANKACHRQRVACAVCALVDWIDEMRPCYLFKECPGPLKCREDHLPSETETEDEYGEPTSNKEHHGPLLKDEDGYYVIDAEQIHYYLDVEKYTDPGRRFQRKS